MSVKMVSVLLISAIILSIINFSAVPAEAAEAPKSLADIVGSSHVDGKYNFTQTDYLNEGADKLLELGTKVIKVWFTPEYKTLYPFNSNWATVNTMTGLAQTSYYSTLFNKPFSTFILEAYEFCSPYWFDGMSQTEKDAVKNEFYLLTKHLLNTYKNTGKTFVLQNWEGDNAIGQNATSTAIQGMIDWLNARQDGIIQARNEVGMTGVKVVGAVEVNKISSSWSGAKVIDAVVPSTYADLYSYSNWETGADAALLTDNLNYIASKAPDSALYGSRNVYMGEFGAEENYYGESQQLNITKVQLETALDWNVVYAVYWEVFCNGVRQSYSGRPANQDLKGWWLIRPDGTYPAVWGYLSKMLAKSVHVDYLNDWTNTYSHTTNWAFDTTNSNPYFEGDTSRARRTTNTVESIVYKYNDDIDDFSAKVYYYGSVTGKVKGYISANGTSWSEISLSTFASKDTTGGWYRVYFEPSSTITSGTKYLKIEFLSDVNIWAPQLSEVKVYTCPVVNDMDYLDSWSKVYSRTSAWSFDTANVNPYFEGDTSRIMRTADTAQNVVYKYNNIAGFTAKVYYYGSLTGKVKFYTSPDNNLWTSLPVMNDTPVNTGGTWYRTNFTPSTSVPQGTKYLKVEFLNDANVWSPQLSQISITHTP